MSWNLFYKFQYEDGYLSFRLRGGSMKIRGILSNVHQLDRSETFRVLVRFQNSWYLFCLARSETFENGNYNSEIDDLPTLRGVTVKRFSGKVIFWKLTKWASRPNFGELEKNISGETFFSDFFSVEELDHIFHFRYFRASTDVCGDNGVTFIS